MRKFILIFLVFLLAAPLIAQEEKADPPQKKSDEIQTWKLPKHMIENLQYMVDEFNRKFDAKIDEFKVILKSKYPEFKDMPEKEVILDMNMGVFIRLDDYIKLQEKAKTKKKTEGQNEVKNEKTYPNFICLSFVM